MSEQGPNQSGTYSYLGGTWLSKGEGSRNEKYHKWADDQTRTQVRRLDRQKHSSMVKLNSQCLEVRDELRGLQQDRKRQLGRRKTHADTSDSCSLLANANPSTTSLSSSSSSSASSPGVRGLRSSTSATSLSSGSSPGSGSALGPGSRLKGAGDDPDRPGGEALSHHGRAKSGTPAHNALHPDQAAVRLKNMHSARALSKLKNNMDIV